MKEFSSQIISEKIIQHTDLKNRNILEIGCGDGRITALLAGKSKTLVAIDPDEKEIKKAKSNIKGVDFQISSGEKTPFLNNSFDLIIFTLSLHHQNSQIAIEEACRVLKDNGRILVIEPVVEGELERVFALLYNENKEKIEAQNVIKASGLLLESSETFEAKWVFEDEKDLIKSIFSYYEMPIDSEIALKITSLLGERINSHPVTLIDLMVIQSLIKTV
jgi:ubiquinone/menaquinone biosynthesis C-methylase UbiE